MAFAVGTVAIIGLAIAATAGTAKAVDGAIEAKKAKADEAKAKMEVAKNKNMFANLDTSNPYQNLENTMEDLTVNQQEAEFQKQQSMQSQANIMQQMRGAAGGSGIAALAQTMAQQSSIDAQRASASIGKQEAANQQAAAAEAGKIQQMERKGELISREQEFGKVQSQLTMSADELAEARKRKQAGKDQAIEGVADIGDAAMDYGGTMGG
tara:strand:- start:765 stop:1394 length:630 start_codon:yes stop_codon:yes gene_type:complete